MVRIHLSDGSFFVLHAEVHAREGSRPATHSTRRASNPCARNPSSSSPAQKALALLARAPQTRRGLAAKLRARGFSDGCGQRRDRPHDASWATSTTWLSRRTGSARASSSRKEGWKALYKGLLLRGVAARDRREGRRGPVHATRWSWRTRASSPTACPPQSAARKLASRGFRSRTIAAAAEGDQGARSGSGRGVNPKLLSSTNRGRSRTARALSRMTESEEATIPS